jgi:chromosome segregation ATPase
VPQLSFAAETEPMYSMTEAELTTLENNLNELATINEEQKKNLMQLQTQLQISEEKLQASEKKSMKLELQLMSLKQTMTEQDSLLANAQKSLNECLDEEKAKQASIKRERNWAYGIIGILLYAYIQK